MGLGKRRGRERRRIGPKMVGYRGPPPEMRLPQTLLPGCVPSAMVSNRPRTITTSVRPTKISCGHGEIKRIKFSSGGISDS